MTGQEYIEFLWDASDISTFDGYTDTGPVAMKTISQKKRDLFWLRTEYFPEVRMLYLYP